MIKTVPFNINHLDVMETMPEYKESLLGLDSVRYILTNIPHNESGDAGSVMVDGRIVICFGYIALSPGVVEVWLLPSIYLEQYSISVIKEIIQTLDIYAAKYLWHRIQTITKDIEQHRKWMKVLGFEEEGRMKKFFQGNDYIMSAKYYER